MLGKFKHTGTTSLIVGGQWGSEGKGAAAAFVARHLAEYGKFFDVVTTNAGAQAGHTSTHNGVTRVVFHLPTYPLVSAQYDHRPVVYLNAGAVIDPDVLRRELDEYGKLIDQFYVHPNAAVITDDCREAEMAMDSAQTRIASTRKGVGEAVARRALRSGLTARDHPWLRQYVRRLDLNGLLRSGKSVLAEVPQGFSLSLDGRFYPHCTSRVCSVGQAMSDAGIHPQYYGETMMVVRTCPIRVGNIYDGDRELGNSGGCYPDQREISWDELGVRPEITTVTKRVRRVFTFSAIQLHDAMAALRPGIVYFTFCDYPASVLGIDDLVRRTISMLGLDAEVIYQYGPSTDDVYDRPRVPEGAAP